MAGWYQQLCTVGGALIIIPFVIRALGSSDAGFWFSMQGFMALFMLMDFGFGVAISRQVAFSLTVDSTVDFVSPDLIRTDPGTAGIEGLYLASRSIFGRVFVCGAALFLLIYHVVMPFTNLLQPHAGETAMVWYLLGASTALNFFTRLSQSFLDGLGYMFISRAIAGTYQLGTNLLIILTLGAGMGLVGIMFVMLISSALQLWAMHSAFRRVHPRPQSYADVDRKQLIAQLWKVSVPIGIMGSGAFLVGMAQIPLLGTLLGPAAVTPLYIALKMSQAFNTAISQIAMSQLAFFTQDCARGHWASARGRLRSTLLVGGLLQLASALCLWLVMPTVAGKWIGAGHYLEGIVLEFFVLNYVVTSATALPAQFVLASGRNPFATSTIVHGLLSVAGTIVLCPQIGLLGVPVATLGAVLLTNAWLTPLETCRIWRYLSRPA
ncbi:hypothetical protein [Hydrocarboniphaga sp.]|uniref:lipopolysaccharide biosynthesis protein n=1 Tax=Hydrocarboniphaga sp. TaxID=2033016 RepID=UPI002637E145|nr:hypothetical protein [Hydrocarboniphaga sp.]